MLLWVNIPLRSEFAANKFESKDLVPTGKYLSCSRTFFFQISFTSCNRRNFTCPEEFHLSQKRLSKWQRQKVLVPFQIRRWKQKNESKCLQDCVDKLLKKTTSAGVLDKFGSAETKSDRLWRDNILNNSETASIASISLLSAEFWSRQSCV